MFVVDSVKLNPGHSEDELKFAAAKKAGIGAGKISEIKILRKSIDARDRENVKLYVVVFPSMSKAPTAWRRWSKTRSRNRSAWP